MHQKLGRYAGILKLAGLHGIFEILITLEIIIVITIVYLQKIVSSQSYVMKLKLTNLTNISGNKLNDQNDFENLGREIPYWIFH